MTPTPMHRLLELCIQLAAKTDSPAETAKLYRGEIRKLEAEGLSKMLEVGRELLSGKSTLLETKI
jgi:hypothetical protein